MSGQKPVMASPTLYLVGAVLGAVVTLAAHQPWWVASVIGVALYLAGCAVGRVVRRR